MSDTPYRAHIESAVDRGRGRGHTPKDRSFEADLVAFTVAHGMWEGALKDPLRPAYALFATTRQGESAFMTNVQMGRRVRVDGLGTKGGAGYPMEFLRSAGYQFLAQRFDGGTLVEVVLTELYEYKPGVADPGKVRFLVSVAAEKLRREAKLFDHTGLGAMLARCEARSKTRGRTENEDSKEQKVTFDRTTVIAEGRRFAAAINERCEVPLIPDPLFGVQLLLRALHLGYAKRSETFGSYSPNSQGSFYEVGMAMVGRAPGLAFTMSQGAVAAWFAVELADFDVWRKRPRFG